MCSRIQDLAFVKLIESAPDIASEFFLFLPRRSVAQISAAAGADGEYEFALYLGDAAVGPRAVRVGAGRVVRAPVRH